MTTSKIRDAEEKVIAYAREKAEAIPLGHFKYLIDALDAARAEEPKAGLPSLADLTGGIDEARIRKIAREEALVRFKNVWDRLTELERRSSADAERIEALEAKAIIHDPDAKPGDCYTTPQPIERDTTASAPTAEERAASFMFWLNGNGGDIRRGRIYDGAQLSLTAEIRAAESSAFQRGIEKCIAEAHAVKAFDANGVRRDCVNMRCEIEERLRSLLAQEVAREA